MLRLVNIKKEYKLQEHRIHALKGIDLSFRESHHLTARLVRYLDAMGDHEGQHITGEALEKMAEETLGRPLTLSSERLKQVLSPDYFVSIRDVTGGPALKEMERMISERASRAADAPDLAGKLEQAQRILEEDINTLLM